MLPEGVVLSDEFSPGFTPPAGGEAEFERRRAGTIKLDPDDAADSMYGKSYKGNERTTFVIGSDGKVAKVLRKVKPAAHDELVLKALEQVGPPVA